MKKRIIIFATFIAVALVATACVMNNDSNETGESKAVSKKNIDIIHENSNKTIQTFDGAPTFIIRPVPVSRDTNRLAVSISPSCNFCGNLTSDILSALAEDNEIFKDTIVAFAMIPRSLDDIPYVAGLMCVGEENYPKAVAHYYSTIQGTNGRRPIARHMVDYSYRNTLEKFGVTDAQKEKCENDPVYHETIAYFTLLAVETRTEDKVPVVVYNSEYRPIHEFSDLKSWMGGN